jgi:hypothetical protein
MILAIEAYQDVPGDAESVLPNETPSRPAVGDPE